MHDRAWLHGEAQARVRQAHTKVIGLSIDPVSDHARWVGGHRGNAGLQGQLSADRRRGSHVAKLYEMIHPNAERRRAAPPRRTTRTIRSVFIVGPDKKIKLTLTYPMSTGAILTKCCACWIRCSSPRSTGRNTGELDAGRGRHHRSVGVQRRGEDQVPGRVEVAETLSAHRPAAQVEQSSDSRGALAGAPIDSDDGWRAKQGDRVLGRLVRRGWGCSPICADASRSATGVRIANARPSSRAI